MITFAKTRYGYDSYITFWQLVEVSGFATCLVDEIDPADDTKTFIFTPMNGEGMERLGAWRNRRARIIWWNLERPEDDTLGRSLASVQDALDAVWVSDRTYAKLDPRFTYVPIAGHPHFGVRSTERLYDVCHIAYLWGRRADAISALRSRGLRIAPEAWGRVAQDQVVAKSHLMLNMHQYEGMYVVAPLRFATAACYAIPIVSEPFADERSLALTLACTPIDQITTVVEECLKDPDRLREAGDDLHRRLCVDTSFEYEVLKAAAAHGPL